MRFMIYTSVAPRNDIDNQRGWKGLRLKSPDNPDSKS